MDLFDNEKEQKKEKVPRIPKQDKNNGIKAQNGQQKQQKQDVKQQLKGQHRGRRQRKKKRIVPDKKNQQNSQITIPLMIKFHPNLTSNQQFQQPLQEFINEMYSNGKFTNKVIQSFQEEDDQGNIQYKLKLIHPTQDRLEHLATQMKFRIKQGSGQAYYRIGVQDNGKPMGLNRQDMFESLKTICKLAQKIHTNVTVLRISQGIKGQIVQLMVRKSHRQGVKLQIRLLLCGDTGSGKSTLLGVLKSGQRDDGKGYSRTKVFTHKHQLMSGNTMTKTHHVIGFDSKGMLYNHNSLMSSQCWLDNANKLLSFIDVGGHKRAQKQIVSSLCSFFPQYALWVLSAKNHHQPDTSNLELAKIFNLPLLVVITHIDLVDRSQQMQTIYQTKLTLKKLYPDKTPCIVKEMEHAVLFSRITSTQDVIPIFLISNVTGKNMDLLINFFNLLPSTSQLRNNQDMFTEFMISDKYVVDGRIILAGTVIKGNIKTNQILHLGPDQKGAFRAVQVYSIECMRVPVKLAKCGQVCTVALKLLNYAKQWLQKQPNSIRRGMVLVESKSNPKAAYQFSAELSTYGKQQVSITSKYQPVVNTLTTRQICSIILLPQQNIQIPQLLKSKKSKSIDSTKRKLIAHRISSNSSVSYSSLFKNKQSVDLTSQFTQQKSQYLSQTNNQKHSYPYIKCQSIELQPILQIGKIKKKKQKQQIKFNNQNSTLLRLRFKYSPEYITVGQKIVINQLKLIGKVKQIFY